MPLCNSAGHIISNNFFFSPDHNTNDFLLLMQLLD